MPTSKLSGLPTATSIALSDLLVKVTAGGAGDDIITLQNLLNSIGGFGAWETYSPAVTLVGGTATNGNAAIAGNYLEIGKTVHFWVNYTVGSTTSFSGLTSVNVTTPTAMSTAFTGSLANPAGGQAIIGGNAFELVAQITNSTNLLVCAKIATGSYVELQGIAASVPAGWSLGNTWSLLGCYESAT